MDWTIAEARALTAAAHPREIEPQGLVAALRTMAGEAQGHRVYCRVVGGDPYPDSGAAEAMQLYRVVETIVDRAIQHGKPHHILVEFRAGVERSLVMTVTDRVGCGHAMPALRGADLADLQARSNSVGATLAVEYSHGALELRCSLNAKGPRREV